MAARFPWKDPTSARRTAASGGATACRPVRELIRRRAGRAQALLLCRRRVGARAERASESTANRELAAAAKKKTESRRRMGERQSRNRGGRREAGVRGGVRRHRVAAGLRRRQRARRVARG